MAGKKRKRGEVEVHVEGPTAPLRAAEVEREIKSRGVQRSLCPESHTVRIPAARTIGGVRGISVRTLRGRNVVGARLANELVLRIPSQDIGKHAYAPRPKLKRLEPPKPSKKGDGIRSLDGFAPVHLALRTQPAELPDILKPRAVSYQDVARLKKGRSAPTTLFPPEDRAQFNDTSYPWGCVGKTSTGGSGVMIGPRHMLTASHVIPWSASGIPAFSFTPGTFDGSAPFGVAWATWVYSFVQVTGTLDRNERRHDYSVVVLDWDIGRLTGWMGSRTYHDSWDGGDFWYHVGYPGDMSSALRPTWERDISIDSNGPQHHREMRHLGDVWPGQSGGPVFAWWAGQTGPHVVSVQSSHDANRNYASGGSEMVDLVIAARNAHP